MNLMYLLRRVQNDTYQSRFFALTVLIFGLMIGIEVAKITCAAKRIQRVRSTGIETKTSTLNSLQQNVSVLCWVLQDKSRNVTQTTEAMQLTWGQRCNKFVIINNKPNTETALQYIYEQHFNDSQWFLRAERQIFVIMENLRLFLSNHDPDKPAAFGHLIKLAELESMGKDLLLDNVYTLSKGALSSIVKRGLRSKEFLESLNSTKPNSKINFILKYLSIPMGRNELDVDDCNKFLSSSHCFKFLENAKSAEELDPSCCSPHTISWSNVRINEMYFYDYLVYKVHIYDVK